MMNKQNIKSRLYDDESVSTIHKKVHKQLQHIKGGKKSHKACMVL